MSEFDMTEDVAPDERPDEEEYEADEREVVSGDTGTHYDPLGEPEATPQDLEPATEAEE
ncbi:hypothetical protein [Nocardioides sp.]|uniref:hypothetical protein n=1 Tax=Nocardioides sp. TaxID=35761 RepID=UPI003783DA4A